MRDSHLIYLTKFQADVFCLMCYDRLVINNRFNHTNAVIVNLFKVNNRNTTKESNIFKVTVIIKTSGRRY